MSDGQDRLDLGSDQQEGRVEEYKFEPIKGYPMLNWRGKRPFVSTQFYPAQLKEVHGPEVDGWRNKIFWGDNLQVMSHLLRDYRGEVQAIYIDPPFDSKADYKKSISIRGSDQRSLYTAFEEKQYSDIWSNDGYLQFIYERAVIARELLSETGVLFFHCDWHKCHYIRVILDEIFGPENFLNQIIWKRSPFAGSSKARANKFPVNHDVIFMVSKSKRYLFNKVFTPYDPDYLRRFSNPDFDNKGPWQSVSLKTYSQETFDRLKAEGALLSPAKDGSGWRYKFYLEDAKGKQLEDIWNLCFSEGELGNVWEDVNLTNPMARERTAYPTQKPEALLSRIIEAATQPNDLVLDFFSGSGTAAATAYKLGRRYIIADINLGAIQTSTRRLAECEEQAPLSGCAGFEVYNVNHYDFFRNPAQAREILLEALEVQPLQQGSMYDGEKDGRMVKIMPVNRIATKADLGELATAFDQKVFQRRQDENPRHPVEKILLVCMGHEPDLKAELELQAKPFKIDVEVVDILRDKSQLEFKRDAEAKLAIRDSELVIENFYPMNLLQKLSLQQEQVGEWRELVDSVMVDWNYDGAVLQPAVVDVPGKDELVVGCYEVPADAGTIRVKITDLLSESWEGNIDG
ncbi:site-specific DNA-methyltransferase [Novosphingobium sp. 9U]|uniref:site-specific DNA-methyltransferase n=1 Tax=Novosphingobium sp. 9U TaxID=2653158 RepID=UPI0012F270E4|nr:site-specific DNA-methyltransferase [Novosphingobium sp. 9U]VWX53926.1 DNA methylase [Novosphingobium sp. 9U]